MSCILWRPELLDDPAFCALMAESPEYLGLWFRCLQIADAAQQDGDLAVFGGKPLTPKTLALAHFRRADSDSLALAAGYLELAVDLGILDQHGERYSIAWWADFGKGLSETREAWAKRKADQRARAKEEKPAPQQASVPESRLVTEVPDNVSRDSHGTVTRCHALNKESKANKIKSINQKKPSTAEPATPPLPEDAAATLERFRRLNEASANGQPRPP